MTYLQPTEGDVPIAAADPGTMTRKLPPLDVRPFKPDDYTQIRQLIADSTLPPGPRTHVNVDTLQLGRLANVRIYFHPVTLALWAACFAALVKVSGVLRTNDWGRTILFTLSMTSAFLITGEWLTRGRFEAKATDIMQSDSTLQDIQKYYGKDRFLVATLGGDEVIGVVGLQLDGKVGKVRHWHVKSTYRNRGLGWDLLEAAIANASKGTKKNAIQRIECETYNLQLRAEKSLRDHGFERAGDDTYEPGILGFFGIRSRMWEKRL
jgi:RimJ/RimL family protein N-acetyltransferase